MKTTVPMHATAPTYYVEEAVRREGARAPSDWSDSHEHPVRRLESTHAPHLPAGDEMRGPPWHSVCCGCDEFSVVRPYEVTVTGGRKIPVQYCHECAGAVRWGWSDVESIRADTGWAWTREGGIRCWARA